MHKLNSYAAAPLPHRCRTAAAPLRFAFVTSREQKQKKNKTKQKKRTKRKKEKYQKKPKETKKNKYIFTLVKRSIFILNTSLEQWISHFT